MTHISRSISILTILLALPAAAPAQTLSPELAILAPLVGKTWAGRMTSPDGQQSFAIERSFEALWDGSVVRFQTKAEVGSPSEGYYYWDREAKQVSVFILNARGVHQRGTVSVRDGVITVEGRIAFPERAFDYRNTFELRPDGTLVDRWFQNAFGDWRPGHDVELKAR